MLLGFKRRFEPMIVDGSKRHTIRAKGRNWRPGVICDCYVDPRQKTMRLLGRWPCTRVENIRIEGGWEAYSGEFFGAIYINGSQLIADELERLAIADGFKSYAEMMEFWRGRLPFEGDLIHWDYDNKKPVPVRVKRVKAAA